MGGMYNMMYGYNPACVWIMPMLGRKEAEWPRFRDCFIKKQEDGSYLISVLTRVGGNNRNCGYREEELYKDPLFVSTEDWEEDDTFAFYNFKVPEKWKADFDLIIQGKQKEISKEYQKYLREFFPILNTNGVFDKIFGKDK